MEIGKRKHIATNNTGQADLFKTKFGRQEMGMLIKAQEVIAILESEAGGTPVPSMADRDTRALRKTLARMKLSCKKGLLQTSIPKILWESGNGQ